jgi:hypothetical protein
MFTAANKQLRHEFMQQYPATIFYLWVSGEAHFHLDAFLNEQNMRFWASESTQSCGDVTPSCKMHSVEYSKQART